jgi:hypothetical protein
VEEDILLSLNGDEAEASIGQTSDFSCLHLYAWNSG